MRLTALGGAKEVGRSAFVLETNNKKFLLDYGIKIEGKTQEYPMEAPEVNGILLSHAHLDHTGYIPSYFKTKLTKIYTTRPSSEISWILWEDYVKVCIKNNKEPKYNVDNIKDAQENIVPVLFGETLNVDGVNITYLDAGHIPGSAMIKIEGEKTVLYTGDIKLSDTLLMKGASLDDVECDVLIMESTYGDRDHPDREKIEREFVEKVREIIENKGFAVLPVFAVGRTQEIAMVLYKYRHILNADIYLDGMGRAVSKIVLRYKDYIRDAHMLKRALENTYWVKRQDERKAIVKGEPSIILATAGMLQGGPIIYYLLNLRNDEKSAVIFTGFQAEDTPGKRVLEEGILEVGEEEYPLKMQIYQYDFSAHSGQSELIKLVEKANPEKVVLVHGEPENINILKSKLEEKGFNVLVPENGTTLEL
jgi:putative mRNA 3-end processing factor